jgi:hypothetical protein
METLFAINDIKNTKSLESTELIFIVRLPKTKRKTASLGSLVISRILLQTHLIEA